MCIKPKHDFNKMNTTGRRKLKWK